MCRGKGGKEVLSDLTCASNRADSAHKGVTHSVAGLPSTGTENYAPAVPLLGTHTEELKAQFRTDICTPVFIQSSIGHYG